MMTLYKTLHLSGHWKEDTWVIILFANDMSEILSLVKELTPHILEPTYEIVYLLCENMVGRRFLVFPVVRLTRVLTGP
jgi:hypothetical protein